MTKKKDQFRVIILKRGFGNTMMMAQKSIRQINDIIEKPSILKNIIMEHIFGKTDNRQPCGQKLINIDKGEFYGHTYHKNNI